MTPQHHNHMLTDTRASRTHRRRCATPHIHPNRDWNPWQQCAGLRSAWGCSVKYDRDAAMVRTMLVGHITATCGHYRLLICPKVARCFQKSGISARARAAIRTDIRSRPALLRACKGVKVSPRSRKPVPAANMGVRKVRLDRAVRLPRAAL